MKRHREPGDGTARTFSRAAFEGLTSYAMPSLLRPLALIVTTAVALACGSSPATPTNPTPPGP